MSVKLVSVIIPLRKQGLKWEAWVQTRHEDGILDGLLEFPGGKIESGETSYEAAARELLEEVTVEVDAIEFKLFQVTKFEYPDRKVCLYFHLLKVEVEHNGWNRGQWHDLNDIPNKLLPANKPIVDKLITYLEDEPDLGEWQ